MQDISGFVFQWSTAKTKKDNKPKQHKGTLWDLLKMLEDFKRSRASENEKNGVGIVCSTFTVGPHDNPEKFPEHKAWRLLSRVEAVHLMILDIDTAPGTAADALAPFDGAALIHWSTYSNGAKPGLRMRIVWPWLRPVTIEEHRALLEWAKAKLGAQGPYVDNMCKSPVQPQFGPGSHDPESTAAPWLLLQQGAILDPDNLPDGGQVAALLAAPKPQPLLPQIDASPAAPKANTGGRLGSQVLRPPPTDPDELDRLNRPAILSWAKKAFNNYLASIEHAMPGEGRTACNDVGTRWGSLAAGMGKAGLWTREEVQNLTRELDGAAVTRQAGRLDAAHRQAFVDGVKVGARSPVIPYLVRDDAPDDTADKAEGAGALRRAPRSAHDAQPAKGEAPPPPPAGAMQEGEEGAPAAKILPFKPKEEKKPEEKKSEKNDEPKPKKGAPDYIDPKLKNEIYERLVWSKQTGRPTEGYRNTSLVVLQDPRVGDFRFNHFVGRIEVWGSPCWRHDRRVGSAHIILAEKAYKKDPSQENGERLKRLQDRAAGLLRDCKIFADVDHAELKEWIDKTWGVTVGVDDLWRLVQMMAMRAAYDPLTDFLIEAREKWDGTPRLANWLTTYAGVEDSPYARLVGTWALIAAVRRAFRPGEQSDSTLILEGDQGAGKSQLIKALVPSVDWVWEMNDQDPSSDKTAERLQGKWLVELAEMAITTKGRDMRAIKAFMSQQHDRYRAPWSRVPLDYPRRVSFWATVNPPGDGAYLSDPTGNRRWWPVRVGTVHLDRIARDRLQLWGEAVALYERGERHWPAPEQIDALKGELAKREETDLWEDKIIEYLKNNNKVSTLDILTDGLKCHIERVSTPEAMRVSRVIQRSGRGRWESVRDNGRRWQDVWTKYLDLVALQTTWTSAELAKLANVKLITTEKRPQDHLPPDAAQRIDELARASGFRSRCPDDFGGSLWERVPDDDGPV